MNNNITLTYENGKFKILKSNEIIQIEENLDKAILKFKEVLTTPESPENISWESIEQEMIPFVEKGLDINNEYKTLTFGTLKYFYLTGKTLSTNGSMIDLKGGYNLFKFAIDTVAKGNLNICTEFIDLCKFILDKKAILSIQDDSFIIRSAKLSYGALEYNFSNSKINKGTSVEKGSFQEFKKICFSTFK